MRRFLTIRIHIERHDRIGFTFKTDGVLIVLTSFDDHHHYLYRFEQ